MRANVPEIVRSSFQFHADLERPGSFLRREWLALAVVGGMYVALMLAILFSIDPAFFYPRIETDQLRYLLKAKSLVDSGTTAASMAINLEPFAYAAMPGVLRAPFLMVFDDFDQQLRGIQLLNVAIAFITATLSAYMLSWILPSRAHKLAIAYSFAFVVLSPDWLTNTFVPLADAPYAALTLGCLILAAMALTSRSPVRSWHVIVFVILFTVAFFMRFTAPVLLVPVILFAVVRWDIPSVPRATLFSIGAVALFLLLAFVALNATAIFDKYISEPAIILIEGDKAGMAINLFGSSLPAQVIPVFNLGFETTMVTRFSDENWSAPARDVVWMVFGFFISGITIRGAFALRTRLAPELACFLAILPILGIVVYSTTRYLMSYQPVIWLCFVSGVAVLIEGRLPRFAKPQARIAMALASVAAIAAIVMLRSARAAETAATESGRSPLAAGMAYVRDVERTYRGFRTYLEGLPRDRSLLVGSFGNTGRFHVIANRNYYRPDANFARKTTEQDVYAILSCGTAAACAGFEIWTDAQTRSFEKFGKFALETVYSHRTPHARALVRRVRLAAGEIAPPPGVYSASGRTDR